MTLTPVKNPAILFRITSDDLVIFVDLELEDYFWELEGLSGDLWKDIDGVKTWKEIKNLHRENLISENDDFDKLSDELLNELVQAKIILLK